MTDPASARSGINFHLPKPKECSAGIEHRPRKIWDYLHLSTCPRPGTSLLAYLEAFEGNTYLSVFMRTQNNIDKWMRHRNSHRVDERADEEADKITAARPTVEFGL